MFSQRGFLVIPLVIFIVVLLTGGVGGYYFYKQNSQSNNQNKSEITTPDLNSPTPSPSLQSQSKAIKDGIIYVSDDYRLMFSSYDGTNKAILDKKLSEEISSVYGDVYPESLSPDRKYLLVIGKGKVQVISEAIFSLSDSSIKIIDLDSLKNKFGYKEAHIRGWASDSKHLVIIGNTGPEKYPGLYKRGIGLYNIESGEVQVSISDEFISEYSGRGYGALFYDVANQTVSFIDGNKEPFRDEREYGYSYAYNLDLKTNKMVEFLEPTMYTSVGGSTWGKFFIKLTKAHEAYEGKKLEVYDMNDPLNPIGSVRLGGDQYFDSYVTWSSDYNYFSVLVRNRYGKNKDELGIYTKDGKFIKGVTTQEYSWARGVFSGDNQRIIVFDGDDDGSGWWKVVNVSTGEVLYEVNNVSFNRIISLL